MPRIVSVGTAVPEHILEQQEARAFATRLFKDSFRNFDRYLPVFDNAEIQTRRLSRPRQWFEQDRGFSERNRAYTETACRLGEEAVRRCLEPVSLSPAEVDHLFFVSTSGLATPSIDARLVNRLGLNRHVKRTPVWGLGCAGGASGLARAYEYTRAFPESRVVLLAVELCSLTFRPNDRSKSNLVASSLFADGAAAVLLTGDEVSVDHLSGPLPRVLDTMSTTWPDSEDVMGWDVTDDGLKVIFSRDIPAIVRKGILPAVEEFLSRTGISLDRIRRFIAHPGGAKVLAAYEKALDLSGEALTHSRRVLGEYGNMSSATVLFVLERELKERHQPGEYGLLTALGPGFSSELILIGW
ncbi:15-methylpalmitoyl-4-hydroxy-2-pyrone synthase [Melghirimyces profundicolus]|uniref:15-methylpalmitoyl-4-hydroxy-2-pyrone synthase n=1 Tax=Melghirimyces profundicolus TaxID=1242148 RepID=A0A2T6C0C5_9BACL|nr:3-oxoacyl-[acyl-carrier-protein] synthase III C-terminal domain-containing protein [Melghirimyces profundicolus]PTX61762.1 15-methylpalmitoyl-4-hydroxy-2-pyrone synthase [Melghirimyces profundicolus]